MIAHSYLSAEEKRAALQSVLQSNTFARADQLKDFLSYVCEMEIAGRHLEISEYQVGVEALHKPEGFSTVDDASVRNRAYALRKKLERFYAEEYPDASVRIEFVKGTYIPRFVEVDISKPQPIQPPSPELPPPVSPKPRANWRTPLALAAGVALGAILTLLAVRKAPASGPEAVVDPTVREAWGPLLDPRGNALISLGSAAQMTLLPFDIKMEWRPELPIFEAPTEIYPWYIRHHRLSSGGRLYMTPDVNSPHFGDVLGATIAIKTLNSAGCRYELLPERVVPTAILNSRNSILFGVPHKSEAIFKLLQNTAFQFAYDEKTREVTITQKIPGQKDLKVYAPKRDERDERVESFGLITVSSVDSGNSNPGRVIAFSGDPSAGATAAVEFFSSPQHMIAFRNRLRAEGYDHFPDAYQILVRCKLDSNLPTSFSYEAHAVSQKPALPRF